MSNLSLYWYKIVYLFVYNSGWSPLAQIWNDEWLKPAILLAFVVQIIIIHNDVV